MENKSHQFLIILALNVFLLIALIFGVHQTVAILNFVSNLTLSSISETYSTLQGHFIDFMKLDIKLIFGVGFCAFVVFYDIYVSIKWFNSFKFTTKKNCKSCSKKLIREQRHIADKMISTIVPLKRFRCVGCGQEYIRVDSRNSISENIEHQVQVEKIKI